MHLLVCRQNTDCGPVVKRYLAQKALAGCAAMRYTMHMEEKLAAFEALKKRCFAARIALYELCDQAGVARSTPYRWAERPQSITPRTLRKLEDRLAVVERERA